MKTFSEITINGTLFSIDRTARMLSENDQYGNAYSANVYKEHRVVKMESTDKGVEINHSSYYGHSPLVTIPKDCIQGTQFSDARTIWFSDKSEADEIMRNLILEKIAEAESSITEYAERQEKFIQALRKEYYPLLNSAALSKES